MVANPLKLSRHGFCLCCVGVETSSAAGNGLSPRHVFAKAQGIVDKMMAAAATAPITAKDVKDGIIVIEGSGGNILASHGADGIVLIDAGIAVSERGIKSVLARFDSLPVNHVVNTHWHFDHADGNSWLGRDGAEIYAHQNTLVRLGEAQRVEDWDFDFPPAPPAALPSKMLKDGQVLQLNGEQIEIEFYGPAHTDSDLSARFSKADVLHTGDTYWNGIYPFIDYSTGGSLEGTIRAAELNLQMAGSGTVVIPGHGDPISDRNGLQAYRDMLVGIRDEVGALKARGLSLDETKAHKPTRAFDAVWGQFVISPDFFTKLVYEGV